MSRTLRLAEQLIARASVTPDDAGCQALIAERLGSAGCECVSLPHGPAEARVDNLWALHRSVSPGAHFPPTSWQVSNLHAGTGARNVIPGHASIHQVDERVAVAAVEPLKNVYRRTLELLLA